MTENGFVTKREEMARIIDPEIWQLVGGGNGWRTRESLKKVDAILDALREPTREMLAAASRIPHARDGEIYQAMLDSIKQEK